MPHFPPIQSLFALVAAMATAGAFLLAFGKKGTVAAVQKRHGRMNLAVAGFLLAACAVFAVCKDLHDIGQSGWLQQFSCNSANSNGGNRQILPIQMAKTD